MAEKRLSTRIIQKHDTDANWDAAGQGKATNPFKPLLGEIIIYDTSHKVKIGDGVHYINELPFFEGESGVFVGKETAMPDGTKVLVDPNGTSEFIIPDVLQTTGPSTQDTISQKVLTDELNKRPKVNGAPTQGQFAVFNADGTISSVALDKIDWINF